MSIRRPEKLFLRRAACVARALLLGLLTIGLGANTMGSASVEEGRPQQEYLSDIIYGISTYRLDYGRVMGADTAAYPLWPKAIPGAPLRVRGKDYAKGIGASYGEIVVMLDGEYDAFTAEVGVQEGAPGTTQFTIVADGKPLFDSGTMTEADAPKPVRVSLTGAQEMRLTAAGVGLGVWADAILTRTASAGPEPEPVDVAPFARVCTWDPARMDGVRVNRLTEFPAEDVFLETDLARGRDGCYAPRAYGGSESCIGLQWLERRRLREIGLRFAGPAPTAEGARAEGWVLRDPLALDGYSEWQGRWAPLKGDIEVDGDRWTLRIGSRENREVSEGTLKIRWILPGHGKPVRIRELRALTTSRREIVDLTVQVAGAKPGSRADVEAYNGHLLEADGSASAMRRRWDPSQPLRLRAKATRTRPWGYDRTVLRFRLPAGAVAVAVDDVVKNGRVYIPDRRLLVSLGGEAPAPGETRAEAALKKSIREQVRVMPDQAFDAALKALYIPVQDRSPTLLSLVADNPKVIVERSGEIGFGPFYLDFVQQRSRHRVRPTFGTGAGHAFSDTGVGSPPGYTRSLVNGWMPMPRIQVVEDGITYRQTVFVAPFGPEPSRPLCVAEIVAENGSDAPREASLTLAFVADAERKVAAEVRSEGSRTFVTSDGRVIAVAEIEGTASLQAETGEGALRLRGLLAPRESARCWVYAPMEWKPELTVPDELRGGPDLRRQAEEYWRRTLDPALRVQTPDLLLNNTIMASQAHCMIAARNEENGRFIDPWISSTYYASLDTESHAILYGMDLMGQHDFARRGYEFFRKRQNPAGYLSHGYTLMGTGQHLWFLSDHYRLTGDLEWWRGIEQNMAHICDWVVRQAAKTIRPGARREPMHGLLPPGTVADWQDWGYIFSMEGYYYAGLARAAAALAEIGNAQARSFAQAAQRLREDIRRAYAWTQARMPAVNRGDDVWVPGSPYQLLKPGQCEQFFPNYSGAWIYDVELGPHHLVDQDVYGGDSPEAGWMADYLEGFQFLREGITSPALSTEGNQKDWFSRGGFPHSQPYYGRYPEMCARADDVKPFVRTFFNQLAPMLNREDLTIYENPGASVWNKTHETGHFLQQARLMLVMERDDALWLAPFVTNRWMEDGMIVSVEQAPTFFGPVAYRIESHVGQGYIEAIVKPPMRRAPKEIVVRLRHPEGLPMRSVTVNGRSHKRFDAAREIIRLRQGNEAVVVRAIYN